MYHIRWARWARIEAVWRPMLGDRQEERTVAIGGGKEFKFRIHKHSTYPSPPSRQSPRCLPPIPLDSTFLSMTSNPALTTPITTITSTMCRVVEAGCYPYSGHTSTRIVATARFFFSFFFILIIKQPHRASQFLRFYLLSHVPSAIGIRAWVPTLLAISYIPAFLF